MFLFSVSNIYMGFEINEIKVYEVKQEITNQVFLMILDQADSSQENQRNISKYSPILESLML